MYIYTYIYMYIYVTCVDHLILLKSVHRRYGVCDAIVTNFGAAASNFEIRRHQGSP